MLECDPGNADPHVERSHVDVSFGKVVLLAEEGEALGEHYSLCTLAYGAVLMTQPIPEHTVIEVWGAHQPLSQRMLFTIPGMQEYTDFMREGIESVKLVLRCGYVGEITRCGHKQGR